MTMVFLFSAAIFGVFALLYTINWLTCRYRDKKYAAAQALAAQQYQQAIEQQAVGSQPGVYDPAQPSNAPYSSYPSAPSAGYPYGQQAIIQPQPAQKPTKQPGKGFARAGLILGIIGLVLVLIPFLVFITSSRRHYSESNFYDDIVLFIIFAILPILSVLFGTIAKRKSYMKKSTSVAIIMGVIGLAIIFVMTILSAIAAFS